MADAGMSVRDRSVLDYGCGKGGDALKYLHQGAKKVYGIDISQSYIQECIQLVHQAGYADTCYDFQVMDAHKLMFDDNVFDLVIGNGILHHLDVDVALAEVHRVTKKGGRALFFEQLADNPLLKLFRRLTPHARTVDETPFSGSQIRRIFNGQLWDPSLVYCGLVEAPVAMITSLIMPRSPDNPLLRWADRLEKWTHKKKILLSWNQYVLFDMVKK
jgi:SAM-dependent methyltransferase